ncbi:hypothetical protein IE53DRAFT_311477 [Violaceomyces palustris]|uniref:Uncharacterized protein n=1 Tax=Violaceomyces palustris TaxID=1673888 RepID=A0ACD0P3Y6_9BASI|nr:hypothetical protein IE53DRAFT_311477 [Violaceomyces palustris]
MATSTHKCSSTTQELLDRPYLLPFHRSIIRSLVPKDDDPVEEGDALIILARGLGLRRIVSTILRIYDGPKNLVVLVNASQDEETGIGEELTTLGVKRPGLRVIHHEMSSKQSRQEIYLSGGILSVTSRILVVDMLSKRIPTDLITGLVVLHAEKVSPTSVEAFIFRIYRQENKVSFLKAFSDDPEYFAIGLGPLQTVMSQLQVRKVELWPRFHKQANKDLGQRKADVIELHQPLSRSMRNIQTAIVECLDATLSELKRSNPSVEMEEFSMENAIFRAFDVMVRKRLDPVWHRVSPKTKQLVGDLTTLRGLLNYLLTYDAVTFNSFLETILASNTTSLTGGTRQNQSPWLFMDSSNVIFTEAKRRVYYFDVVPVLEELPKWSLLKEVLDEIEQEIHFTATDLCGPTNNTILIMTESDRTCSQVREILSSMDECPKEAPGRHLMEHLLGDYLYWKSSLGKMDANLKGKPMSSSSGPTLNHIQEDRTSSESSEPTENQNEALKRKASMQRGQQKRRRQRGGSVGWAAAARKSTVVAGPQAFEEENAEISGL